MKRWKAGDHCDNNFRIHYANHRREELYKKITSAPRERGEVAYSRSQTVTTKRHQKSKLQKQKKNDFFRWKRKKKKEELEPSFIDTTLKRLSSYFYSAFVCRSSLLS